MAPNRSYPAVCATRQPIPAGHEMCPRASNAELSNREVAHLCPEGVVLGACLVNVKASEIGPRLEQIALAAGTDPAPPQSAVEVS